MLRDTDYKSEISSFPLNTYIVDISQPFRDVIEALGVCDVVDEHDAHSAAVVGRGDGVKPLLAGRVPAESPWTRLKVVCHLPSTI